MTPLISGTSAEGNASLMDDGMQHSLWEISFRIHDKNSNSVSFVSERYFSTVVHQNDGMDTDMGGPGSSGSHTPPSRHGASPVTNKPQNAAWHSLGFSLLYS